MYWIWYLNNFVTTVVLEVPDISNELWEASGHQQVPFFVVVREFYVLGPNLCVESGLDGGVLKSPRVDLSGSEWRNVIGVIWASTHD